MGEPEIIVTEISSDISSWIARAACLGMNPNFFFDNESRQQAKEYCIPCPVKNECFNYAVESKIEFGVWGGEIFDRSRKK